MGGARPGLTPPRPWLVDRTLPSVLAVILAFSTLPRDDMPARLDGCEKKKLFSYLL